MEDSRSEVTLGSQRGTCEGDDGNERPSGTSQGRSEPFLVKHVCDVQRSGNTRPVSLTFEGDDPICSS